MPDQLSTKIRIERETDLWRILESLVPRQKLVLFLLENQPSVTGNLLALLTIGVLEANPTDAARLLLTSRTGEWPDGWSREVEVSLANDFEQPICSKIVARLIHWGVGTVQILFG